MKISIVIPAYNAEHSVGHCLEALQRQTMRDKIHEIILVDNNSTDRTVDIARGFPGVTVLVQPKKGAAASRNMGIAHATGDIICFTDADCIPLDNWVEMLYQPKLLSKEVVGMKGTYLTTQKEVVARFVQIEYEDKYDLLRPEKYINFVDTYSAVYWRDILIANEGGFDEGIFFAEDRELAYRIASRGYKMAFQPEAKVYHLHSNTLLKYFQKKVFIGYWTAQTIRRFPQRGVKDSHTPQVLKLQMGLMLLFAAGVFGTLLSALLSSFLPPFIPISVAALTVLPLLVLCFSALPFVRKAWVKDKTVALASIPLLAVRGLALSIGYVWGVVRPTTMDLTNKVTETDTKDGQRKSLIQSTVGLFFNSLLSPFRKRRKTEETSADQKPSPDLEKL